MVNHFVNGKKLQVIETCLTQCFETDILNLIPFQWHPIQCMKIKNNNMLFQSLWQASPACCLYYKHITIINTDSRIGNKFGASLTDDARVVIYDCHVFIVQATGLTFASSAPFSGSSLG